MFKNRHTARALPLPVKGKSHREYWHESEEGFGVRVMSGGRRVYLARFTALDGRDKKQVIGVVDDTDYIEARDKVRGLRRSARQRKDGVVPIPSLLEAYTSYVTLKADKLAPATLADYEKRFKYLKPIELHPLDALLAADWEKQYLRIKTAHGTSQAQGVLRLAAALYARALNRRELTHHPIKQISADIGLWSRSKPASRFVPKAALPAFWRACEGIGGVQRDFLRVALFTGWRTSILGALRWERVNIEQRTYRIAAEDKGNKAKQEVFYPLPDWLWDNVFAPRLALRRHDSPWVLPSPKKANAPTRAIRGAFATVGSAAGMALSAHDLRRTFASIAQAELRDITLIARLLIHSVPEGLTTSQAVTAGYVQHADDDFRVAVNRTAAAILRFALPPAH